MLKRNLIIASILMMFAFAGSTLAQERGPRTKVTKSPKPNIEGATNQNAPKPKQTLATKGHGKQEMPNDGDLNANKRTTSGGKSMSNRNLGIVTDNNHPDGEYSRKKADGRKSNLTSKRTTVKKPKGVIILDQDTQTVVAPGKRKRNK